MKVLMINSNRYKLPVPSMPFGLCCVASAVEHAGHEVRVLDLCFSKKTGRDIADTISEFQPDVVGVGIRNIDTAAHYNTLFQLGAVNDDVIVPLKKIFSGPIVIGGPAVGISGVEMLSFFDLALAIRGDGEIAMVELLDRLQNKQPLEGIGGLVRRKDGEIVEDNLPLRVIDLDALPFPRQHHFIHLKPYRKLRAPIQIQTKRGCELGCTYCTYNTVEGHKYRLRDPQRVADEIEMIVKETGIKHFEFFSAPSTFHWITQKKC